jgi:hypothetical protein
MFRKPSKSQLERVARKVAAMKRGKERAAMARKPVGRMPLLPSLRRIVTVTDFDTGKPVEHTMRLYKTRRVDSYRAEADGVLFSPSIGWSDVMAAMRKAFLRLPSPRSDFWWDTE